MIPEQVLHYAPITQSGISPDGRWLYAVVRRSRADGVRLELSLRDLSGGGWRAPGGDAEKVSPSINRASSRWAALARVEAGYRVVVGALGSPAAPTAMPRGPHRPRVLKWDCRDRLACLGDDARGDTRVWLWRDEAGEPDWVTAHQHRVVDYAMHPTKERLAWLDREAVAHPYEEGRTRLWLGWLAPREPVELVVPGYLYGYLSWSPDGRWLAWQARDADAPLSPARLWAMDLSDLDAPGAPICLSEGLDGAPGGYDWSPDGGVVLAVESGTRGALYRLLPDALGDPPERLAVADGFLSGPRFDRAGGRMVFLRQSMSEPQRLCLREPGGAVLRAGHFSRALDACPRATGRTLRWEAGGLTVEGPLVTPPGEGPWPLLIWAHGGPAHHISETFSPYFQVLAGAGYAVLAPNYRGSTGRGRAFCEAGVGALCEGDAGDLRAGIDAAIAAGVADPTRIGAVGWSYGGALALALARDDPRVRAVAAGATVADWMGLLGANTFPTTAWRYVGSRPWEDRAPWDAASPATWIQRVRAPTLLLHGTEDPSVPFSQSVMLYRMLSALGVTCELAWYRGEGHTISSPVAVVDMLRQILAWLALHLGETDESAVQ